MLDETNNENQNPLGRKHPRQRGKFAPKGRGVISFNSNVPERVRRLFAGTRVLKDVNVRFSNAVGAIGAGYHPGTRSILLSPAYKTGSLWEAPEKIRHELGHHFIENLQPRQRAKFAKRWNSKNAKSEIASYYRKNARKFGRARVDQELLAEAYRLRAYGKR